jgi:hypothetical protein
MASWTMVQISTGLGPVTGLWLSFKRRQIQSELRMTERV